MRMAALYDIHGNLPALEAVLADVRNAGVDRVVVGGDVLPGPMPRETLGLLLGLDLPVEFIYGNGELAVLAQLAAGNSCVVTYWGTLSGEPLPEPLQEVIRWTASALPADAVNAVRAWPGTLEIVQVHDRKDFQAHSPGLEVILEAGRVEISIETKPRDPPGPLKRSHGFHLDVERRSCRTLNDDAGCPGTCVLNGC